MPKRTNSESSLETDSASSEASLRRSRRLVQVQEPQPQQPQPQPQPQQNVRRSLRLSQTPAGTPTKIVGRRSSATDVSTPKKAVQKEVSVRLERRCISVSPTSTPRPKERPENEIRGTPRVLRSRRSRSKSPTTGTLVAPPREPTLAPVSEDPIEESPQKKSIQKEDEKSTHKEDSKVEEEEKLVRDKEGLPLLAESPHLDPIEEKLVRDKEGLPLLAESPHLDPIEEKLVRDKEGLPLLAESPHLDPIEEKLVRDKEGLPLLAESSHLDPIEESPSPPPQKEESILKENGESAQGEEGSLQIDEAAVRVDSKEEPSRKDDSFEKEKSTHKDTSIDEKQTHVDQIEESPAQKKEESQGEEGLPEPVDKIKESPEKLKSTDNEELVQEKEASLKTGGAITGINTPVRRSMRSMSLLKDKNIFEKPKNDEAKIVKTGPENEISPQPDSHETLSNKLSTPVKNSGKIDEVESRVIETVNEGNEASSDQMDLESSEKGVSQCEDKVEESPAEVFGRRGTTDSNCSELFPEEPMEVDDVSFLVPGAPSEEVRDNSPKIISPATEVCKPEENRDEIINAVGGDTNTNGAKDLPSDDEDDIIPPSQAEEDIPAKIPGPKFHKIEEERSSYILTTSDNLEEVVSKIKNVLDSDRESDHNESYSSVQNDKQNDLEDSSTICGEDENVGRSGDDDGMEKKISVTSDVDESDGDTEEMADVLDTIPSDLTQAVIDAKVQSQNEDRRIAVPSEKVEEDDENSIDTILVDEDKQDKQKIEVISNILISIPKSKEESLVKDSVATSEEEKRTNKTSPGEELTDESSEPAPSSEIKSGKPALSSAGKKRYLRYCSDSDDDKVKTPDDEDDIDESDEVESLILSEELTPEVLEDAEEQSVPGSKSSAVKSKKSDTGSRLSSGKKRRSSSRNIEDREEQFPEVRSEENEEGDLVRGRKSKPLPADSDDESGSRLSGGKKRRSLRHVKDREEEFSEVRSAENEKGDLVQGRKSKPLPADSDDESGSRPSGGKKRRSSRNVKDREEELPEVRSAENEEGDLVQGRKSKPLPADSDDESSDDEVVSKLSKSKSRNLIKMQWSLCEDNEDSEDNCQENDHKSRKNKSEDQEIDSDSEKNKQTPKYTSILDEKSREQVKNIVQDVLNESSDDKESSDDQDITSLLDLEAEECEEDSPYDDSNDIPVRGESVGYSSSDFSQDESYEHDSFIISSEDEGPLLSPAEISPINTIKSRRSAIKDDSSDKKWSRINSMSDSELAEASPGKVKESPSDIKDDSSDKKWSRIISVSDSDSVSDSNEDEESNDETETETNLLLKENLNSSLTDLVEQVVAASPMVDKGLLLDELKGTIYEHMRPGLSESQAGEGGKTPIPKERLKKTKKPRRNRKKKLPIEKQEERTIVVVTSPKSQKSLVFERTTINPNLNENVPNPNENQRSKTKKRKRNKKRSSASTNHEQAATNLQLLLQEQSKHSEKEESSHTHPIKKQRKRKFGMSSDIDDNRTNKVEQDCEEVPKKKIKKSVNFEDRNSQRSKTNAPSNVNTSKKYKEKLRGNKPEEIDYKFEISKMFKNEGKKSSPQPRPENFTSVSGAAAGAWGSSAAEKKKRKRNALDESVKSTHYFNTVAEEDWLMLGKKRKIEQKVNKQNNFDWSVELVSKKELKPSRGNNDKRLESIKFDAKLDLRSNKLVGNYGNKGSGFGKKIKKRRNVI